MNSENKQELTQEKWREVYNWARTERSSGKTIDLGFILDNRGFSRHIHDISFFGNSFDNFVLTNLSFHECNFSAHDFRNLSLYNLRISRCNFSKTKWLTTSLKNVFFNDCNLSCSEIIYSELDNVSIMNTQLSASCWNYSKISQLQFESSILNESLFYSTSIRDCSISNSTLNDVFWIHNEGEFLQTNCATLSSDRPVIGMAWDFLQRGTFSPYIDEALKDNSGIVLKIEMESRSIDVSKLNIEVTQCLNSHAESDPSIIVKKLFRQSSSESEIGKIRANAIFLLGYCDALVLPGGKDIETEFYTDGQALSTTRDYRRSIVEFALLTHAQEMNIPTMGTCRGSQMINVYFGGTLKNVEHQNLAWQKLSFANSSKKEELQRWIGQDSLFSLSMHHQACDKMGDHLEVVIEFEGIPKLFISHDDQFIGVQFHPEVYVVIDYFDVNKQEAIKARGIYQLFFSKILKNFTPRM